MIAEDQMLNGSAEGERSRFVKLLMGASGRGAGAGFDAFGTQSADGYSGGFTRNIDLHSSPKASTTVNGCSFSPSDADGFGTFPLVVHGEHFQPIENPIGYILIACLLDLELPFFVVKLLSKHHLHGPSHVGESLFVGALVICLRVCRLTLHQRLWVCVIPLSVPHLHFFVVSKVESLVGYEQRVDEIRVARLRRHPVYDSDAPPVFSDIR